MHELVYDQGYHAKTRFECELEIFAANQGNN